MNRIKAGIFFMLMAFVATSCSTGLKFMTTKAGNEPSGYKQQYVYALPRTVMLVSVEVEKKTWIPGPYQAWAEYLLGLSDVINEPGYSYSISSVHVEPYSEPDPDQYYTINVQEGILNPDLLKLTKKGYILDASGTYLNEAGLKHEISDGPDFSDIVITANLTEVTDTLYKTVITDTSFIKVPVLLKQKEVKTLEQKAEEAADLIMEIRENRYQMMSVDYDLIPDGKTLEVIVRELTKMEKDYIALFTGKMYSENFVKRYLLIPDEGVGSQDIPFAWFSATGGLRDAASDGSKNMVLRINNQNTDQAVSLIKPSEEEEENSNRLWYRAPGIAEVSVLLKDYKLYEARMSVWQEGKLLALPFNP